MKPARDFIKQSVKSAVTFGVSSIRSAPDGFNAIQSKTESKWADTAFNHCKKEKNLCSNTKFAH